MIIRLTQMDGKLPNLALMKLASYHRDKGDEVVFTRDPVRNLFEPAYDRVYGSVLFDSSAHLVEQFRCHFPQAIIGGTGSGNLQTVEQVIGQEWGKFDYGDYPNVKESIGFTQRGCRMHCRFCVVPEREGKPRATHTIPDIWRGPPHPRKVHLLDNDFFGQPEEAWRARINELREGKFRVCFGQGINVRSITDAQASALASVEYRDTKFQQRRLYTAWDNPKDEGRFFAGMDTLEKAGIPPRHVMAYMLVGFDPAESWDGILSRFNKMADRGIKPYPMVFDARRRDLKAFQRWAVTGLYRACAWEEYRGTRRDSVVHLSNNRWKKGVSANDESVKGSPHG
ncbi:MAG: radical SAM protein [Magnetococcales bacterium]|nr:radical SAM protein [Magnetococcales bacterium]